MGHSGEGQPISNEQRREDMGDREGTEKRGQRHPHFVYFSTLPGADLGMLPVCVDSGTSFGKNFNFPKLSAWCQWFLSPKAKNANGFFFFLSKMQHVSNKTTDFSKARWWGNI